MLSEACSLLGTVLKRCSTLTVAFVKLYSLHHRSRPPFSHRGLIGQYAKQADSYWLISPFGRVGKNEEIRLGRLEGIVSQLITSLRWWYSSEKGSKTH